MGLRSCMLGTCQLKRPCLCACLPVPQAVGCMHARAQHRMACVGMQLHAWRVAVLALISF